MKRFLPLILIVAATTVLAQEPPHAPETVSVTGTGRVTLTPDRFTFTVGVQTLAATVDAALAENNQRVANVIAALKKGGATEKEIRTSSFAIWPQQAYDQGQPPRITGYQVSNNVTVVRDKIADAGKLLQSAVSAGVNVASGLQFQVSDPVRGRDQGLKAAVEDARARATVLAQAAGRTLGRALAITEGTTAAPPPRPFAAMAMAKMESAEVPVEAGMQENAYTVSVVFELR